MPGDGLTECVLCGYPVGLRPVGMTSSTDGLTECVFCGFRLREGSRTHRCMGSSRRRSSTNRSRRAPDPARLMLSDEYRRLAISEYLAAQEGEGYVAPSDDHV